MVGKGSYFLWIPFIWLDLGFSCSTLFLLPVMHQKAVKYLMFHKMCQVQHKKPKPYLIVCHV